MLSCVAVNMVHTLPPLLLLLRHTYNDDFLNLYKMQKLQMRRNILFYFFMKLAQFINMIICSYITFLLMIHFPSFLWLNKGFHYACVSHFLIQYPFVGNLHWFHNLAIMARSAKNTDNLNASLWCADLEFCGKIPRSGIAGS